MFKFFLKKEKKQADFYYDFINLGNNFVILGLCL